MRCREGGCREGKKESVRGGERKTKRRGRERQEIMGEGYKEGG